MTPHDKYKAGMRSIVVALIKRELHNEGKVLEPARGPDSGFGFRV